MYSTPVIRTIHRVSNGSFIGYQKDHSSGVILPKERQSFVSEAARAGFGAYSLPGFADSAVSNLNLTVNDYNALWDMLRSDYSGRLVDVLDVKMG